jgi:hypothetical protein
VAVVEDDDVRACLERNLTPELLVSLSRDETDLTEDILRECLETQLPDPLVWLLGPIVEEMSECTLDVSKTLTNQELIALGGPDSAQKDEIVDRVTGDILECTADGFGIPVDWLS